MRRTREVALTLRVVTVAGAEPSEDVGDPAGGNGMNAAPGAAMPAAGRVKLAVQATTLNGAFDGAVFASAFPRGTFFRWVDTIGLWRLVAVFAVLLGDGAAVSVQVRGVAR